MSKILPVFEFARDAASFHPSLSFRWANELIRPGSDKPSPSPQFNLVQAEGRTSPESNLIVRLRHYYRMVRQRGNASG